MNDTALQTIQEPLERALVEQVLLGGDLSGLNTDQRLNYYNSVCESLQINPLTRPFEYIKFDGKIVLYARKDATDQLRDAKKISIFKLEIEEINGFIIATAHANTPDGRQDIATGVVSVKGLQGNVYANARMKAE